MPIRDHKIVSLSVNITYIYICMLSLTVNNMYIERERERGANRFGQLYGSVLTYRVSYKALILTLTGVVALKLEEPICRTTGSSLRAVQFLFSDDSIGSKNALLRRCCLHATYWQHAFLGGKEIR